MTVQICRSKFRIFLYVGLFQSQRLKRHPSAMYLLKLIIIFVITKLFWLTLWIGSLHEYKELARVTHEGIGGVRTRVNKFECKSLLVKAPLHKLYTLWMAHGLWKHLFIRKDIERQKGTERKGSKKKKSNQEDTPGFFPPVFKQYNNENFQTAYKTLHYTPVLSS